jgi:FkbM family methyltransferase
MSDARIYHGLGGLDRKMRRHLDFDDGYFVEIGANDGVSQSNTLHFERCRGWRGVLVEPSHANYFKCRANRSPRTKVFCAACVPFGYTERFVPMIYSNLMSISELEGSDLPDARQHAESGRRFLEPDEDVVAYGAVPRTLNDLLIEADAPPSIDFFSLDVEGSELAVLQGVDHGRFRFRHLLVECRSLPRMDAYLAEQGYRHLEQLSVHDHLFIDAAGAGVVRG